MCAHCIRIKFQKNVLCMLIFFFIRARQEQLERQAEIQRKKEEEVQRKLEEKNKSLSSSNSASSWRNDKNKDDQKLFGSARDNKERREGGFGRNRDDGPPSERRSLFSRGNEERKGGVFSSRDNDRGGWNRGGGASSGGAFDKNFKDGPRDGVRSAFDRDTPRKREIPSSNDQVN